MGTDEGPGQPLPETPAQRGRRPRPELDHRAAAGGDPDGVSGPRKVQMGAQPRFELANPTVVVINRTSVDDVM